ncbi:hypothetical protein D3C77_418910 [compost metagenome]
MPWVEGQLEQVVVLLDLAAGIRQCVAGALRQTEVASAVRQVEFQMIERRVGQLQQPAARPGIGQGGVTQIQPDPEHRGRVTGIQYVSVVGAEMLAERRGAHLRNAGVALTVLEHLHHPPQGQAAR